MQVTTGGSTRAKLLFRLALAAGLGIILASMGLIWGYRMTEIADLEEQAKSGHQKMLAALESDGGQKIAYQDVSLLLGQTAVALNGEASLWRESGEFAASSSGAGPASGETLKTMDFRLVEGASEKLENGKLVFATMKKLSLAGENYWLRVETEMTADIAKANARALRVGAFAFLFEGVFFALLLWMARRGDESLIRSEKEQLAMENELFFLSHYDTVTHLPNRTLFWERLDAAITRAGRLGKSVALCVFDVDEFTSFNEEHGRSVGDKALQEMARRLQAAARANDLVCRIGADEFVIVLEDVEIESVSEEIRRCRDQVARQNATPWAGPIGSRMLKATGGASYYPKSGGTSEELLAQAQKFLIEARRTGSPFGGSR